MINGVCKEVLVSVLVPCYNHEKFLMDCIDGLINQTYRNIELIVYDDCSTDQSWGVLQKSKKNLENRFKKLILLKNDVNQGLTKNLNRMLASAQGKYIKIIASDDILHREYISSCVEFFERNPDVDVIVTNGYRIEEESSYQNFINPREFYITAPNLLEKNLFEKVYKENIIFAPGAILRKSVYEEYGNYNEKIAIEDWEYWLRILKDGKVKFYYLDTPLVYYRENSSSFTSLTSGGILKRRKRLFDAEMAIIELYGSDVKKKTYQRKKFERLLVEKKLAIKLNNIELERWIDEEARRFGKWNYYLFIEKCRYIITHIQFKIKK